jgi:hypothetical protein
MRKIMPIFGAATVLALVAGNPALAGTEDFGTFTVTATNSQFATAYPGASTFADSDTFAGYTGSVATPVATITGGALNPGGSTNPDTGINNSIANYVAAVDGSDETITFNRNQEYFGLLWGSVDVTNTISFYDGATLVASFTGGGLEASTVGLEAWPASGSFVDFLADGSGSDFNKVVLSATSGGAPFETSNFAAAVPEPATWAMMILGLGAMGAALRRRGVGGPVAA